MRVIKIPSFFLLEGTHLKNSILRLNELIRTRNSELAIDFSELQEIRKGDLMVLLAQLEKSILSNKNRIYRKGSLPRIKKVKDLLTTTDKILHMNKAIAIPQISDSEKAQLINPVQIDSIVKDLKKIGIKEYYYPFNVFLTELVGNAVEHGIENLNINWWLSHEIDMKAKIAKYTFVDMGLGIVDSHKKAGLPFKYFFLSNKHIVLDSLFGRLGSSTKQINRGRGLPQLREMIEKELITNLVLITNNVSLQSIAS